MKWWLLVKALFVHSGAFKCNTARGYTLKYLTQHKTIILMTVNVGGYLQSL